MISDQLTNQYLSDKHQIAPYFMNQHTYLRKFLATLGEQNIFSVCIKDINQKTVCFNNTICGEFWGLSGDTMHGMTAREILTRVPHFKNVERELEQIEQHEKIATQTRHPSIFQQIFLSYAGYIQVRQSLIIPVNGISNRLIATAGLALDLTRYIHPLTLLRFYRYYYPRRSETVARCLKHFNLDTYFYQNPSYEELRILFTMIQDYRHKQIAHSLGVSPKTVANYLSSLRDKLKAPSEIYHMLSMLRAQHTWDIEMYS